MKKQHSGKLIWGIILIIFAVCGFVCPGFLNINITCNGVYQASLSQTIKLVTEIGSALIGALLIFSYQLKNKKTN